MIATAIPRGTTYPVTTTEEQSPLEDDPELTELRRWVPTVAGLDDTWLQQARSWRVYLL